MNLKEKDLILPAVAVLGVHKACTTADMIARLTEAFPEKAGDATFERCVRNLKSHDTLVKKGLARYLGVGKHKMCLTPVGRGVLNVVRSGVFASAAGTEAALRLAA